jgi:hypothetical protein
MILRDLREDHQGLVVYQSRLAAQDAMAERLLSFLDAAAPADTLAAAAGAALTGWNYEPSYPTYRGLVQSGGLGQIRPASVWDEVIIYHDETVAYLDRLRATEVRAAERAGLLAERHFRRVPGNSPERWDLRLVSSVAEIRRDREFLGALGTMASARRWVHHRIGQIFLPANEALSSAIEVYLGAAPAPPG